MDQLKAEIFRLEREAGRLVRFVAEGGESETVRAELLSTEAALRGLRGELATRERAGDPPSPVSVAWVRAKLDALAVLVRQDAVRARVEIGKHLDGALTVTPLPAPLGQRRAEIRGRVRHHSLLSNQEAVCLPLVAGGRYVPPARVSMPFTIRVSAK